MGCWHKHWAMVRLLAVVGRQVVEGDKQAVLDRRQVVLDKVERSSRQELLVQELEHIALHCSLHSQD